MKSIKLACTASLLIASLGLAINGYSQSWLTNGLVAYYPFNGNANDESGNGNSGTNHGAVLTVDRFGYANRAFSFNSGTLSFIDIAAVRPAIEGLSRATLSIWFQKSTDSPAAAALFADWASNYGANGQNLGCYIEMTDGKVTFCNSSGYEGVRTLSVVSWASWHHLVVVFDGTIGSQSQRVSFTIDGVAMTNEVPANSQIQATIGFGSGTFLGRRNGDFGTFGDYFDGSIDDVRIYNRALSSDEVAELYKYESSSLNAGLVAFYPFNGNANDASGNENNGTVNGATLTTDRFGSSGKAYSFDGNSFIGIPNSPSLASPHQSVTLSAWVRQTGWWVTGANRHAYILSKDTPQMTPVRQYAMSTFRPGGTLPPWGQLEDGLFSVGFTNFDGLFMNHWVHVVMTFEVPVGHYYVNGVACDLVTPYPASQNPLPVNSAPLEIGRSLAGYTAYFNGQLDDIRIYNRALSSNEVQQLYAIESQPPFLTNGLVAYYPFNGNANDESVNGNSGTTYGASLTTDRFGVQGKAMAFNGTNQYIQAPHQAYLNFPDGDFTVAFWAVLKDLSQLQYFVGKDMGQGIQNKWIVLYGPGPALRGLSFCINGPGYAYADVNPEPGMWHHFLFRKSSTNYTVFFNGVSVSSGHGTSTLLTNNSGPLTIGQAENGGYVNGKMDDIRIYNRALSSNEVAQLYAYESTPFPPTPIQPAITSQPQSVTVHAHDSVSFSVVASGDSPLAYQWSLNGTNISGATASSVTISNVTQNALGAFSVIVTNVAGSVISSNAMLTMYPFIRSPFLGAVTFWGKDATFSVEAWGSEPLSYQWFQNGLRVLNATNQTLTLTSIQFTNAGLYSIVVSNTFGSVTNAPAQVVVNPAGVSLGMYPGVVVSGVVGYTYNIQATSDLTNTNSWTTVATLTLMLPVQLWVDTQVDALSPTNPHKYYKVVPGF